MVRCTLCNNTLSGNKMRHLKGKHPIAFAEMQREKQNYNEVTFVSRWVADADRFKNYVTKVGARFFKCTVCKAILKQNYLKSHMQKSHPEILENERDLLDKTTDEKMDEPTEELENSDDEIKSQIWSFFKKLANSSLNCKLCGSDLKDMKKHLMEKHPVEYLSLSKKLKGKKIKAFYGSKKKLNLAWLRKYLNRFGPKAHECDVCKQVLSSGLMGNINRHFKLKHPYIYSQETNRNLDSDAELETLDQGMTSVSRSKTVLNKGWVRKYVNRLGFKEHECIVCKKVLSLTHGFIGNMRRHFKNKHPSIYARENNRRVDVVEDEKDDKERKQSRDSGSTPILNKGWVRKYTNRLSFKEHECIVCKKVLNLTHGFIGNMRRHFQSKHPEICAKENNRVKSVEDEKEQKESDDMEETHEESNKEIVKDYIIAKGNEEGEEEYVIEYLVEETTEENFPITTEPETIVD